MEMEDIEIVSEAIRGLQAGQIAQGRILRALISSHPNPEALRAAWHRYYGGPVASSSVSKVTDPAREVMHDAVLQAMRDWDRRLEEDLRGR